MARQLGRGGAGPQRLGARPGPVRLWGRASAEGGSREAPSTPVAVPRLGETE